MSKRVRIFLAALALAVVAIVLVLILSSGPKDATPKLSFTLSRYNNHYEILSGDALKDAIVTITNREACAVSLRVYRVLFEGQADHPYFIPRISRLELRGGASTNVSLNLYLMGAIGSKTARWQVLCSVERRTAFNKLRTRVANLPVVGHSVWLPSSNFIRSDWFTQ